MGCQLATTKQQGLRSSPSGSGKPRTHAQMQRPYATSPATKHGETEKTKSCGYPSVCQVCNASLITKASCPPQVESLEAPKGAEWGGDNAPVGHHGPCVQQKRGCGPQHEQKHAKTRGQHEGTGPVTIRMPTQTHTLEKKAPEPRKHTK